MSSTLLGLRNGVSRRSHCCRVELAEERHQLCVAVTIAGIPGTLGTQKDRRKQKLWKGQQGWDRGLGSKEKWRVCASLCCGLEECVDLAKDIGVPQRERGHEDLSKQGCSYHCTAASGLGALG